MPKLRSGKQSLSDLFTVGVYFLFQGDEIVYVGKSTDIVGRIKNHIQSKDKLFDGWDLRVFPVEKIGQAEAKYIRRLKPKYNRQGNPSYSYDDQPFSSMNPKGLIGYYKLLCDGEDVALEAIDWNEKAYALGWWSYAGNATIFNKVWQKQKTPTTANVPEGQIIAHGREAVRRAILVFKNAHPIIRKMVEGGESINNISARLAISDVILTPFLRHIVNPEVHWWKQAETVEAPGYNALRDESGGIN